MKLKPQLKVSASYQTDKPAKCCECCGQAIGYARESLSDVEVVTNRAAAMQLAEERLTELANQKGISNYQIRWSSRKLNFCSEITGLVVDVDDLVAR